MYHLAQRTKGARGSIIRDLLKLAAEPGMISFGGGAPDAAAFPAERIAEIAQKAFLEQPGKMLGYGVSEGYPPFVASLKAHLSQTEKLDFSGNEAIVLSGGQQCADLVAKLFLDEGDWVVVEAPSFVGCMNAFRSYGAQLKAVPLMEDGVDLDALETAFRTLRPKLFYLISTFQNPSGTTTSLEKRKAIYRLAQRYRVMIFEDNPYGELRFEGEWIPSIKSMDEEGLVLYAGSFSKTLAPGLRVGFLVYPALLHPQVKIAKQGMDVHSSTLYQLVCHEFLTNLDYAGHVKTQVARYKEKAAMMVKGMEATFHPAVRFNKPQGGLFIMAWLPEDHDSLPFVHQAVQNRVITVPDSAFTVNPDLPNNGVRLNYSLPTMAQIEEGIAILGTLSHRFLGRARSA